MKLRMIVLFLTVVLAACAPVKEPLTGKQMKEPKGGLKETTSLCFWAGHLEPCKYSTPGG